MPELEYDPWPAADGEALTAPAVPAALSGRSWISSNSGSLDIATFIGADAVLRVARNDAGAVRLACEVGVLTSVRPPLPSLLEHAPGWALIERLPGSRPAKAGPWVVELAAFVRDGVRVPPGVLRHRPETDLSALYEIAGTEVVEELLQTSSAGGAVQPTHGDLHCGNLLVDEEGHLSGVLDLDTAAMAPPECEAAAWLLVLSGQLGLSVVRDLAAAAFPRGLSGQRLRGELVRGLAEAADVAVLHPATEPYRSTVSSLALTLVLDPGLPLALLGVPDSGTEPR